MPSPQGWPLHFPGLKNAEIRHFQYKYLLSLLHTRMFFITGNDIGRMQELHLLQRREWAYGDMPW